MCFRLCVFVVCLYEMKKMSVCVHESALVRVFVCVVQMCVCQKRESKRQCVCACVSIGVTASACLCECASVTRVACT